MGKDVEIAPDFKGKLSIDMLRHVRNAITSAASHEETDRLYIKDIVLNRLSLSKVEPCPGTLEALIDDVLNYLDKSLADFTEFMKENKSLDSVATPE